MSYSSEGRTTTSPDGPLSHESELVGPFRPVPKFFMTNLYFVNQKNLFEIFSWRGTNELYEESVYKLASLSKCWKTILYLA